MMAQKPLMLKEYLELDSGSDSSSSSSFRCAPRRADTVRCLLEAELRRVGDNGASRRRQNARSKSAALTKLSAVINAVRLVPFSSSSSSGRGGGRDRHSGGVSMSLITGGFWKRKKSRRREEPETVRVLDIVRLHSYEEDAATAEFCSFAFPSPVVSSCSSCSRTVSSSASDFVPSSLSSSENLDDIAAAAAAAAESKKESSPPRTPKPTDAAVVRRRSPPKEIVDGVREMASPECRHQLEEEEKEQLSPVSVMDFPYEPEDDDEDEEDDDHPEDDKSSVSSPSFNQSLANLERTKLQLLQKIRRFESLAELDSVDLQKRFEDVSTSGDEHETASSCESDGANVVSRTAETRAWALLDELRCGPATGPSLGTFEKLLVDFFLQGLRRLDEEDYEEDDDANPCRPSRSKGSGASCGAQREEAMLRAARDWMRGHVDETRGDATITEMEGIGRWRCRAVEEELLGADLEGYVFGLLLDEVVVDLGSGSP